MSIAFHRDVYAPNVPTIHSVIRSEGTNAPAAESTGLNRGARGVGDALQGSLARLVRIGAVEKPISLLKFGDLLHPQNSRPTG